MSDVVHGDARRTALGDETAEKIRTALERSVRTIERRPSKAIGTAVTRVRVEEGMTCEIREGDWVLSADLPARWGGSERGPNPGVLGRGALGACLSMAYVRWAAEAGLPLDRLEVEIEADYDARGELGMADVTPAYTEVRWRVEVESPAPEEEVRRVFARAEERCPYLTVFADPAPMRRELVIGGSGGRGASAAGTGVEVAGDGDGAGDS